jgi:hypothetical protein
MLAYDGGDLNLARKDEAWALDPAWRTSPKARPLAYLMDPENRTDFTLVPPPIVSGIAPAGSPVTADAFEPMNLVAIYARTDLTLEDGPYRDLQLPLALETVARELGRDSDHQDRSASEIAHKLADFFARMALPEMAQPGVKTGST